MNKAIKLIIQGKVQGVGYRRWFEQQALALELKGYVKNLESSEVEAVVVGTEHQLHSIIERSYIGPSLAEVSKIIQVEYEQAPDFTAFKILR
ncbi:acylphosphatase [Acinetobacter sp. ANC 4779]|uniref:acylphosphatase n=1 Tax=Acinetobacter sp. ANC 4779 TaxID=2529848 RepID=UPI00103951C6|nr:acylphosphatase [Acinetobacter sp. ANC 4779]TCB52367.1 acylphosphatase [Acinetobacter sp. ANC 4779]